MCIRDSDDCVGALAVLHHLVEIALQHIGDLADLPALLVIEMHAAKRLAQFVDQFDRDRREIVDEAERILDLVGDAGGQLAEGGKLLGLDEAVLGSAQVGQRSCQFPRTGFDVSNSRAF